MNTVDEIKYQVQISEGGAGEVRAWGQVPNKW